MIVCPLDQLVCPIGLPDLQSKDPAHIGLSVAAQIASWLEAGCFLKSPI